MAMSHSSTATVVLQPTEFSVRWWFVAWSYFRCSADDDLTCALNAIVLFSSFEAQNMKMFCFECGCVIFFFQSPKYEKNVLPSRPKTIKKYEHILRFECSCVIFYFQDPTHENVLGRHLVLLWKNRTQARARSLYWRWTFMWLHKQQQGSGECYEIQRRINALMRTIVSAVPQTAYVLCPLHDVTIPRSTNHLQYKLESHDRDRLGSIMYVCGANV